MSTQVALFTRAWIEICKLFDNIFIIQGSPSLRGRGLKCNTSFGDKVFYAVALFTRAWIEMDDMTFLKKDYNVALFTRAWIEM